MGTDWQEVQLLRAMAHPNIVTMLDSFVEEGVLVIVFEWAAGGDLKRVIRQRLAGGRPFDEAVIWAKFKEARTDPRRTRRTPANPGEPRRTPSPLLRSPPQAALRRCACVYPLIPTPAPPRRWPLRCATCTHGG